MSISMLRLMIFPILFGVLISGCSMGRTSLSETYYYAVPSPYNEGNTNFYRLRLTGGSLLSKTQYRHGYYPARAVDAFLGNVQLDKGARELELEDRLMTMIDEGTEIAWKNYIAETVATGKNNSTINDDKLKTKSDARRKLLEYPQKSKLEIDYNPAGNIITYNSNNKLIFFLSSNPNEVMSRITSFAEDEKTIQSVNRLSQFIAEPKQKEFQTIKTQNKLLETQLKAIASKMDYWHTVDLDGPKSDQAITELLTLLSAVATEVKP